jgi:hypothetical protein
MDVEEVAKYSLFSAVFMLLLLCSGVALEVLLLTSNLAAVAIGGHMLELLCCSRVVL